MENCVLASSARRITICVPFCAAARRIAKSATKFSRSWPKKRRGTASTRLASCPPPGRWSSLADKTGPLGMAIGEPSLAPLRGPRYYQARNPMADEEPKLFSLREAERLRIQLEPLLIEAIES